MGSRVSFDVVPSQQGDGRQQAEPLTLTRLLCLHFLQRCATMRALLFVIPSPGTSRKDAFLSPTAFAHFLPPSIRYQARSATQAGKRPPNRTFGERHCRPPQALGRDFFQTPPRCLLLGSVNKNRTAFPLGCGNPSAVTRPSVAPESALSHSESGCGARPAWMAAPRAPQMGDKYRKKAPQAVDTGSSR